jgi:hypothetical protein
MRTSVALFAIFALSALASACAPKCPAGFAGAPAMSLANQSLPNGMVIVHSADELRAVVAKLPRPLFTSPTRDPSSNLALPSEQDSFTQWTATIDFAKSDVAVLPSGNGRHVEGQVNGTGEVTVYSASYPEPGPAGGDPNSYAASSAPYRAEQLPGVALVVIPKGARVESRSCSR